MDITIRERTKPLNINRPGKLQIIVILWLCIAKLKIITYVQAKWNVLLEIYNFTGWIPLQVISKLNHHYWILLKVITYNHDRKPFKDDKEYLKWDLFCTKTDINLLGFLVNFVFLVKQELSKLLDSIHLTQFYTATGWCKEIIHVTNTWDSNETSQINTD